MLLRLLRLNSVWISEIIILIWGIVWFVIGVRISNLASPYEGMPLFRLVASLIFSGSILKQIAGFAFILITGVYTASFNTRYLFVGSRQMPFIFFILIAGSRPGDSDVYPVLMALPFILWSVDRLISTYRVQKSSYHAFEAGLLIGVSSFFYAPAMVFIILVLVGVYLFRQSGVREHLLALTGYLLPFGFYFAGLFILNKPLEDATREMFSYLLNSSKESFSLAEGIWTGCYVIVLLISSYFMIFRFQTRKIIFRRSFTFFFWWFVLSLITFFLVPSAGKEILLLPSVPVSYLFSEFFLNTQHKKWGEFLLWLMVISLIFYIRFQVI